MYLNFKTNLSAPYFQPFLKFYHKIVGYFMGDVEIIKCAQYGHWIQVHRILSQVRTKSFGPKPVFSLLLQLFR